MVVLFNSGHLSVVLLTCLMSPTLENEEKSPPKDKFALKRPCPIGQYLDMGECVDCTKSCPRFMYMTRRCSWTKDAGCSKCFYRKHGDTSLMGLILGKKIKTWNPTYAQACDKENTDNAFVVWISIVCFILIFGFAVLKLRRRRLLSR